MTPHKNRRVPPFGRVQFAPQALAQETGWCRKLGLDYVATDPVSNLVLQADDMHREGHERAAYMLRRAAMEVARAQKIAAMCARRLAVLSKQKMRVTTPRP